MVDVNLTTSDQGAVVVAGLIPCPRYGPYIPTIDRGDVASPQLSQPLDFYSEPMARRFVWERGSYIDQDQYVTSGRGAADSDRRWSICSMFMTAGPETSGSRSRRTVVEKWSNNGFDARFSFEVDTDYYGAQFSQFGYFHIKYDSTSITGLTSTGGAVTDAVRYEDNHWYSCVVTCDGGEAQSNGYSIGLHIYDVTTSTVVYEKDDFICGREYPDSSEPSDKYASSNSNRANWNIGGGLTSSGVGSQKFGGDIYAVCMFDDITFGIKEAIEFSRNPFALTLKYVDLCTFSPICGLSIGGSGPSDTVCPQMVPSPIGATFKHKFDSGDDPTMTRVAAPYAPPDIAPLKLDLMFFDSGGTDVDLDTTAQGAVAVAGLTPTIDTGVDLDTTAQGAVVIAGLTPAMDAGVDLDTTTQGDVAVAGLLPVGSFSSSTVTAITQLLPWGVPGKQYGDFPGEVFGGFNPDVKVVWTVPGGGSSWTTPGGGSQWTI